VWTLGALCSIVPDLDRVGSRAVVPYETMWGPHGVTHSPAFAAAQSAVLVAVAFRTRDWASWRLGLAFYFSLAAASHGALDAMTNGGLGVGFFAPFDATRYFLPFRPIKISPLGVRDFLPPQGVAILTNEFFWTWLPSGAVVLPAQLARRRLAAAEDG